MYQLNRIMLILHFLGLAMGIGAAIANLIVLRLMAAAPQDRPALSRFPPLMGRVGDIGLLLLWATGITLVFTRWAGFGSMPGLFHAKLTAVVALTVVVGVLHVLRARMKRGDASAARLMPMVGRVGLTFAVLAVVLAVFTFN
jgi:hypothetical protein